MPHSMSDERPAALNQSRPAGPVLRLGLSACLVGAVLLSLSSGPALSQAATSGSPDPMAWSEWRQQHLALEYQTGSAVLSGHDSATVADWLQDHLRLEYPDSLGR